MSNSIDIINEFNSVYEEDYYAWNPFYPLADIDLKYYLGDQWNEKEKQALYENGRTLSVFNLIRKNINLVDGYQRCHRLSSIIVPQEPQNQEAADELSDLVQYVYQAGDGYKCISDCFSGALKTGWNLATVWMDFRDDCVDGDIKFGREPYSGFITSPYFTQLDFSDCPNVIRRKYVSPEQACSLLPGLEDEIWSLHRGGWARDDKFTWLPYQRQPNGQDFLAYNEYYKQMWKKIPILVDTQTGEHTEWNGPHDALKVLRDKYPQLKIIQQPKRYIECHIIINNTHMKTLTNQYGLDEYPLVPFVGVFEAEHEYWGLKLQSLTRCMIDPQTAVNRRLSQMIDLVESQINSGWIADEDSVVNPRALFQTSQGRVVWRDKNSRPGALEKIPPADVPQSFFQLADVFMKGMSEIIGVNDAAFGIPESGNESGVMMMLRQGAAVTNLQCVFDNLRYAQKQLTRKVLKLIQTWSPRKVERILGRKPTDQFFSKDFIKYDISIQEGMMTDTQRQMHFRQMVDMYQMTGGPQGSPITPTMLIKAAPIQGASTLFAEIDQNQKQQAQAAQVQSQVQSQLMEGQMQYQKAAAVEKMAGAKERFTRAFADVGLSDERAAKAVDERASAALSRIKGIKELFTMDDERLFKYLNIINMLEEMSTKKEEEIKQGDLAIASHGQELGDKEVGKEANEQNPQAGGQRAAPPPAEVLSALQGATAGINNQ